MPPENVRTWVLRRSQSPTMSSTCFIRAGDEPGLDPVELGVHAEVLLGGQVAVECRVLEYEADVPTNVVALRDDVMPGDRGAAARRLGQCAEHVDRRRLAGPVWPEEPEDLPGRDFEADAAHGFDLAVGLAEIPHLDRWCGQCHASVNSTTVEDDVAPAGGSPRLMDGPVVLKPTVVSDATEAAGSPASWTVTAEDGGQPLTTLDLTCPKPIASPRRTWRGVRSTRARSRRGG